MLTKLLFLISVAYVYCNLEVITTNGVVKGKIWTSQKGREFVGFTGIPYAEPPIGKLRFQPPLPVKSWRGVLDTTKTHEACAQGNYFTQNYSVIGSEDCLYLNIYKPMTGKNHPVMFYIYGGSFYMGSGADNWYGPETFLDRDVVLVTVNYRVGSLGFLSLEDKVQPGNNGLKDQALALRWIKENIRHFGGNETNISVFGNSAGAMSTQLLTMSPLTKDLISKVIIQSGFSTSALSSGVKGAANAAAKALGRILNCSTTISSEYLISCLQDVDVVDIVKNEFLGASNKGTLLSPFFPIAEVEHPGAFITDDPVNYVKQKKFANIPMIFGVVHDESSFISAELNLVPGGLQLVNDDFATFAAKSFFILENVENTTNALRQFYFGNKTIDNSTLTELTDMLSDGGFVNALDVTLYLYLKYKSEEQPIYVYLLGYRGSASFTDIFGDPSINYGVCHTDELYYMFPRKNMFPHYHPTKDDSNISDALTQMWFDFSATGNPTPQTENWKPLKDQELQYLHIQGPNEIKMDKGLFESRRLFWRQTVYPALWDKITGSSSV